MQWEDFFFPQKDFWQSGGIAQVTSCQGGSRTHCVLAFWKAYLESSPSPYREGKETALLFFAADEGFLYPPAVLERFGLPLNRLLVVKVKTPQDVWRVSLEAVQSGLFLFVGLRASQSVSIAELRKLQLFSEKQSVKTWILCNEKLPSWLFGFQSRADAVGKDLFTSSQTVGTHPSSHEKLRDILAKGVEAKRRLRRENSLSGKHQLPQRARGSGFSSHS